MKFESIYSDKFKKFHASKVSSTQMILGGSVYMTDYHESNKVDRWGSNPLEANRDDFEISNYQDDRRFEDEP